VNAQRAGVGEVCGAGAGVVVGAAGVLFDGIAEPVVTGGVISAVIGIFVPLLMA